MSLPFAPLISDKMPYWIVLIFFDMYVDLHWFSIFLYSLIVFPHDPYSTVGRGRNVLPESRASSVKCIHSEVDPKYTRFVHFYVKNRTLLSLINLFHFGKQYVDTEVKKKKKKKSQIKKRKVSINNRIKCQLDSIGEIFKLKENFFFKKKSLF